MNLLEEVEKIRNEGYDGDNAAARLCQDLVLLAISRSPFSRSVTIKGGVVMRNVSHSARRATQDIDLDFIRHSISDDSIRDFVQKLNCIDGIRFTIKDDEITELKQEDYKGKRVFVVISDDFSNSFTSKIDIGVHKDFDIEQEEYCFDIFCFSDGANLLMNSCEQIIAEKLKSLVRFGAVSTRYKDVFDIYYLKDAVSVEKLRRCLTKYIFDDSTLKVTDMQSLLENIERTFSNKRYTGRLKNSKKNWLDLPVEDVLAGNIKFLRDALA